MTHQRPLLLLTTLTLMLCLSACAGASHADYSKSYRTQSEGSLGGFESAAASADAPRAEYAFDDDAIDGDLVQPEATTIANVSGGARPAPAPRRARKKSRPPTSPSGSSKDTKPQSNTPDQAPDAPKRLIIYTADLGLFVFELEDSQAKARALVTGLRGWIQQSTTQSLTIRVPVENFETLVNQLSELGDIQYKNVVGTDVSEEFFDLQIRMRNAEALRTRFAELLKQAKTVEDSLKIEKELARLTDKIERMKGRIKYLSDRGTFSTITVNFSKKPNRATGNKHTPLPFRWLRDYSIGNVL